MTVDKIATFVKVSTEVAYGLDGDDFIKKLLTAQLYAHVQKAAEETGSITVFAPPPSFLDWLLKRSRPIRVTYTIRHLAKFKPKETLPIINFD